MSGLSILGGTMMGRKGSILADDGCIFVGPSEVRVCKSHAHLIYPIIYSIIYAIPPYNGSPAFTK